MEHARASLTLNRQSKSLIWSKSCKTSNGRAATIDKGEKCEPRSQTRFLIGKAEKARKDKRWKTDLVQAESTHTQTIDRRGWQLNEKFDKNARKKKTEENTYTHTYTAVIKLECLNQCRFDCFRTKDETRGMCGNQNEISTATGQSWGNEWRTTVGERNSFM